MTTLREAATQALEAMDKATRFMSDSDYRKLNEAIDALKVALVEDAMQKFTDVNQELQAVLGCDHCNQPLYAAIKCRVCGRVTEPVQEPVCAHGVGKTKCSFCSVEDKQPMQEPKPVAWMHVPYPGNAISPMLSLSKHREPSMYAASVPLYLKEQL